MENENKRYLYFDIPKKERESAISYLLTSILKSRELVGMPSNQVEFDEDVNIYLAHLLFAASLPDYQEAVKRYVSLNISDVTDLVDRSDDRVIRYFIYKVNADHLLVHLGIFNDLEASANHFYCKSEHQYASMAQAYYEQAAQYHRRIYRRQTAIGSVLGKLAKSFGCYKEILHNIRKDFFHFSNEFQDMAFTKFCDDLKRFENENQYMDMMDLFLDSYATWKKTKDPSEFVRLHKVVKCLKEINPQFTFKFEDDIPEGGLPT
ncbi:MAG: hypothetical protein A3G33_10240 [Omnitrophica bacterium RIFCSPLOWO2_12_FULL_44_17]|uniref:Uncharacterized protein n=1 Tax=Candidatus Danuiimicrobium aquiferis TaxID=1801832 RepID=A0A1G1L221_9BACT|nr:MAG: hypothetical protein A3B72_08370 [Omnitrophica bacterium RIFCSPHIGHO2_02_FULL_45_28]OGW91272.1 MAG: hypothetical protein A3E74_09880 [Omnitrophica bacterium RIFCSPHIGHO2_12_FULL_44_12]OGW99197.1 MAG: hypothetical protein A3G33_10240 [Omnitrophica bacterium RIFCSPLOWO2_12_FULL_44_17]OGX04387.1 MAG: hypothetical protein A3J12_00370 [Omnitrophica bacterium RIFCSPLOWO2_02_FULL_44_11]